MNPYLLRSIVIVGGQAAPNIVIPLLLAVLLWMGRASVARALLWLSGAALALALVEAVLFYLVGLWSHLGVFREVSLRQQVVWQGVSAFEGVVSVLSSACAIAAITVGLFAATQQRHWRWVVALVVGAMILWNALGANAWMELGRMLFGLPLWMAWMAWQRVVSLPLLAHLTALIALLYGRALTRRPLADGQQLRLTERSPQPDAEARTADATIE